MISKAGKRTGRFATAIALIAVCALASPSLAATSSTTLTSGDVNGSIALSDAKAAPGSPLGVTVDLTVAPGWHIYGTKVSDEFIPTTLRFAPDHIAKQSWNFPPATPVNFEGLGETIPVYTGKFSVKATVVLAPNLKPGEYQLTGTLKFQECNDNICKVPQAATFSLPVTVQ